MAKLEIYVSTDVEVDGPIPGDNSMLSFASAAYLGDGKLLGTFTRNCKVLSGAQVDADTMKWWDKNREQFTICRQHQEAPRLAMEDYVKWLSGLKGKVVFVGYPASFDFMFVYWYLMHFIGKSPFSFAALDIKSYAMAVLGTTFKDTSKRKMPKEWFLELPKHTHVALDDAIEQGALFCNIMKHAKALRVCPESKKRA